MISRTLSRENVASLEVIERRRVVLLGQRDQVLPASALRLHEHVASNASAVNDSESSGARWYGADRSAECLGESDEKPLRRADVAEPIRVFIPDHFAYELRTALAERFQRVVDVVHGEH